jgi:hypothetical protein
MNRKAFFMVLFLLLFVFSAAAQGVNQPILGMHCAVSSDEAGLQLLSQIPELRRLGINTLIIEVGYSYQWKSHPELCEDGFLSEDVAKRIAGECRLNNILIIPLIECVGHQSWDDITDKLLLVYPDFDETPGMYDRNKGIYCRSWCVSNDSIYPVVFDLIDEITCVFDTRFIHVGMDEIFLIGEDACPRCRGKRKDELLALAINKIYEHCVTKRKLTMLLWGDRLIDGNEDCFNYYSEWDSSKNDTSGAVMNIPKDIVICDWHYDLLEEYGSLPYFLDLGFSVLPTSYKNADAAKSFIGYSLGFRNDERMLGHLYTNWGEIENDELSEWKPMLETIGLF